MFVLALLIWVMMRYNQRANPVPSKDHHNTLLEVAWTIIPVIILVLIAVPSFQLLYFEADIPKPDVTINAIGKQWFWTYQYPKEGGFQFDSLHVEGRRREEGGRAAPARRRQSGLCAGQQGRRSRDHRAPT